MFCVFCHWNTLYVTCEEQYVQVISLIIEQEVGGSLVWFFAAGSVGSWATGASSASRRARIRKWIKLHRRAHTPPWDLFLNSLCAYLRRRCALHFNKSGIQQFYSMNIFFRVLCFFVCFMHFVVDFLSVSVLLYTCVVCVWAADCLE